jgi:hypothetical protein
MLRITTSHSAEGAKKYFDVSLKTSSAFCPSSRCWSYRNSRLSTIAAWSLRATPNNIIAFSGAMLSGS